MNNRKKWNNVQLSVGDKKETTERYRSKARLYKECIWSRDRDVLSTSIPILLRESGVRLFTLTN